MGASDYTEYATGSNPTTVFDALKAQRGHEDGYSYSGTISQAEGFTKASGPLPLDAARLLAADLLELEGRAWSEKGGPAGAIPIAPNTAFRTRHKMLYLNPKDEGYLDYAALAQAAMQNATIAKVEVVEDKQRTKVEASPQAKQIKSYEVVTGHMVVVGRADTLPKANALAKQLASESHAEAGEPPVYFVYGRLTSDGIGGCLRTYRQQLISRKVKLKVTYVEQTRKDPAPIGWLFFGWAPS